MLATHFYRKFAPQIPGKTDGRLINLSDEIKSYAASVGLHGDETFRNPNGVYMKLMELRKYDPEYLGKGLGHGKPRPLEQEIWDIPNVTLQKFVAVIRDGLAFEDGGLGFSDENSFIEEAKDGPNAIEVPEKLSKMAFESAFEQFEVRLLEYNGSRFSGFDSGVIEHWESYKTELHKIALKRLAADQWHIGEVGTGRILSSLIDAIEIRESATLRNNLVAWEARPNQPSMTLQLRQDVGIGNSRQQFEKAIFDLFRGDVDHKTSLGRIVELIGRRYPIIAYIFFLADNLQFMPIAPQTFDQAFAMLGLTTRMSGNCSWENYQAYNDAIRMVQEAFVEWKGIPNTRLIDAHSWIWMMARLPREIERLRRQGVRKPDDVKYKMIDLGRSIISRVATSNGQSEERIVKNKDLFGFTSEQALYDFLNDLWKQQKGRCKLTGLSMVLNVPKGEPNDMVVSVDRIDSDSQYTSKNLQLTCWFANRWKGTTPNDHFIRLLKKIQDVDDGAIELAAFGEQNTISASPLERDPSL